MVFLHLVIWCADAGYVTALAKQGGRRLDASFLRSDAMLNEHTGFIDII